MTTMVRRWGWLGAIVAIATVVLTLSQASSRPREYISTGTYVVRADVTDENDRIRAIGNLSDARINSTFAYIIESDLIAGLAHAGFDSGGPDGASSGVEAVVVPGSNIIVVSARSEEPDLAYQAALAAGDETISYVDRLDGLYDLVVLDPPTLPSQPVSDGRSPFVLAAAGSLGLAVGAAVSYLAHLIFPRGLSRSAVPSDIYGTGLNDERYTRLRFHEEVSRTDDSGVPFQFAVVQVEVPFRGQDRSSKDATVPDRADRSRIARAISPTLRDYDHLGHLATIAPGTFALILPGLTESETKSLSTKWHDVTAKRLGRSYPTGTVVSVASCRYEDHDFRGEADAEHIAHIL